jgi:hypothetical protein
MLRPTFKHPRRIASPFERSIVRIVNHWLNSLSQA